MVINMVMNATGGDILSGAYKKYFFIMASVVKELFGKPPSFLKVKASKSLWHLTHHLPNYGIGYLVQPAEWYQLGSSKYFKITKVYQVYFTNKGVKHVHGKLCYEGKEEEEKEQLLSNQFKHWGFYQKRTIDSIHEKCLSSH